MCKVAALILLMFDGYENSHYWLPKMWKKVHHQIFSINTSACQYQIVKIIISLLSSIWNFYCFHIHYEV